MQSLPTHALSEENKEDMMVFMRSEVLTVVKTLMLVFWIVTSCGLVGRYVSFSEMSVFTYKSTQHYDPRDQHWKSCL
jgi:hypothetical protein